MVSPKKCKTVDLPNNVLNLSSLVRSVVENIHVISKMKCKTFSMLEYAQYFGSIVKESLERTMK